MRAALGRTPQGGSVSHRTGNKHALRSGLHVHVAKLFAIASFTPHQPWMVCFHPLAVGQRSISGHDLCVKESKDSR